MASTSKWGRWSASTRNRTAWPARLLGVATTHEGVEGLARLPVFQDIDFVFDATSAGAHVKNDAFLRALKPGIRMVDLTPAAIGPYCIPVVNGEDHLDALNVNMVTCGGQATIPMVAAVSRVARVHYGEIVASISSKSAGPGTRANIDEFTETTSKAIEAVGGATRGKAIIVLNPAEPPLIMRDTVYTLSELANEDAIARSVENMAAAVQAYVPGYRMKQKVQFDRIDTPVPARRGRGAHRAEDLDLPGSRGRGPLPACLCGQPGHHDQRGPAHRGTHGPPHAGGRGACLRAVTDDEPSQENLYLRRDAARRQPRHPPPVQC